MESLLRDEIRKHLYDLDEIPYSEWQSLGSKIADIILERRK